MILLANSNVLPDTINLVIFESIECIDAVLNSRKNNTIQIIIGAKQVRVAETITQKR